DEILNLTVSGCSQYTTSIKYTLITEPRPGPHRNSRKYSAFYEHSTKRVKETSAFPILSNTAPSVHPPVGGIPRCRVRRRVGREVVQMRAGHYDENTLKQW